MTRLPAILLCALAVSAAGGAEPELAKQYGLEVELRKEGRPRTVEIGVYRDTATQVAYYATPDRKAVATAGDLALDARNEPVRAKWVRRFELPVRDFDAKEFAADTPKVLVEVFSDTAGGELVYVSESGALAVADEPAVAAKVAAPRWLYRLPLKVRPAGENDFTRDTMKINVEVYLHEPTGHLLYVGHSGALAVVPTKKTFADLKAKPPRWTHALELKARDPKRREFDPTTKKIGVEIYADDNAGVLLYATDAGTLAAVTGAAKERAARDIKAPVWHTRWVAGTFVAEVFTNPNAGHTLVVTSAGGLAVVAGEPRR
ncbi:MAG: hypothetical protein FJ304_01650 [Planctomycetes bacterium]|nr:hypothetical protein [Planctomycetota bacterium]